MDTFRKLVSRRSAPLFEEHRVTVVAHADYCTISDGKGIVRLPEAIYKSLGRQLEMADVPLNMEPNPERSR
jgi:hypothetical protein